MHLSLNSIQRIPIDRSGTDCQTGCFGLDLRSNLITTNKASKVPIGLLHRQPPTAPKDPSAAPSPPVPSLSWACARCAQASSKIKIQSKLHYAAACLCRCRADCWDANWAEPISLSQWGNGGARALTKIWFDGVCTNEIVIFAYLNLDIVSGKCMQVQ